MILEVLYFQLNEIRFYISGNKNGDQRYNSVLDGGRDYTQDDVDYQELRLPDAGARI